MNSSLLMNEQDESVIEKAIMHRVLILLTMLFPKICNRLTDGG